MRCLVFALVLLAAALPAWSQAYPIDPAQSEITYAMSHPFVSWAGTSGRVTGVLVVEDGRVVGGRASAPVASFDSGVRGRDADMLRAVDAARFPDVTFEARAVSYLPPERRTDDRNAFVAGALTFHGVRREVTMPVYIDRSGDTFSVRGTFAVEPTNFGVEPPSILLIEAQDRIELTFLLTASQG
jgi:polyisoprenoid-binding protein YceI